MIVFHFPATQRRTYIKRLVGLPGETVRISHGALWIRNDNDRRRSRHSRSPASRRQNCWPCSSRCSTTTTCRPSRNRLAGALAAASGWSFAGRGCAGNRRQESRPRRGMVRYQHLVPSFEQWQEMLQPGNARPPHLRPQPDLRLRRLRHGPRSTVSIRHGPRTDSRAALGWRPGHAVARSKSRSDAGRRSSSWSRAAGGSSAASIWPPDGRRFPSAAPAREQFHPTAVDARPRPRHAPHPSSPMPTTSCCSGSTAAWCRSTRRPPTTRASGQPFPDAADLSPAGIASRGAESQVSHLKLLRNIYYIADRFRTAITPSQRLTTSTAISPTLPTRARGMRSGDVQIVNSPLGAGSVFRPGRQQRREQGRPAVGHEYWVAATADRQGAVHLLAAFVGQVRIIGKESIPVHSQLLEAWVVG